MSDRPEYINPPEKWRKISRNEMLQILRELKKKQEEDRRKQREALNEALASGFRCGPKY